MYISKVKLPDYFYDITHPRRWYDPFCTPQGEERLVLTPDEIRMQVQRNDAYLQWLKRYNLKGSIMKWQAVRVLRFKHSKSNPRKDWFESFQDASFRVFTNPYTFYEKETGEYFQWYVLCPEDCELVNRYLVEKNGPGYPPRDPITEPFFSLNPKLRRARAIPVECCSHLRNDTTAGQLPAGL